MHPLLHLFPAAVCVLAMLFVAPDTARAFRDALRLRQLARAAGFAAITAMMALGLLVSIITLAGWAFAIGRAA